MSFFLLYSLVLFGFMITIEAFPIPRGPMEAAMATEPDMDFPDIDFWVWI